MMRAEISTYNQSDSSSQASVSTRYPSAHRPDKNKYKAALQNIGDGHQHNKSFLEELRLRIKKGYTSTRIGKLYQHFQIFVSVMSCIQFVGQTYVKRHNPGAYDGMRAVEVACASFFFFDWCLNLFITDHFLNFFIT
ncbi:hypothetical protein EON65_02540 [archaeon]|nr:MAG: hypothetical protein EON65_02540 [archaeon]